MLNNFNNFPSPVDIDKTNPKFSSTRPANLNVSIEFLSSVEKIYVKFSTLDKNPNRRSKRRVNVINKLTKQIGENLRFVILNNLKTDLIKMSINLTVIAGDK